MRPRSTVFSLELAAQLQAVSGPEPIAALNRIKERECGEPLVNIRRYCPRVRIARTCLPYLRRTVAEKLSVAQAALPPGYKLRVTTALRKKETQQALFDTYFAELSEKHPNWSYATLRRQTCRFFAPYDQPAPPGHCTGAAVDVHLLLPSGRQAEMRKPLTGWKAARSLAHGLSEKSVRHREILFAAMLAAGFSNCAEEFWHYSYGDAGWAVRVGEQECVYGWPTLRENSIVVLEQTKPEYCP
ncbi:M15 family metallopeptidase [Armatimonas sp.]|uniref:M15 family metallopeptidase n=1 Tax=Armatimonas sp. TaxID=1872638 RepID=UPI003752C97C